VVVGRAIIGAGGDRAPIDGDAPLERGAGALGIAESIECAAKADRVNAFVGLEALDVAENVDTLADSTAILKGVGKSVAGG